MSGYDEPHTDALERRLRRAHRASSAFGGPMPTQYAGQLDLDGNELRALSIYEQHYACCSRALAKPSSCVCFFESTCPEHGDRHNGTHD